MTGNNGNQLFSDKEILSIREGIDGVKHVLPPRFYYDETIYQHEVEHVLKKNWLFVGRWDEAENPGDYFTIRMWSQSIIIVRDKKKQLHALVNVCQHRYSQVVEDGSGNTNTFMCPYHRWTYDLDGRLKGMSVQDIPGVDKKKCTMPSLRVEEWQGFIFINYDPNAKALAPQLEGLDSLFDKFQLGRVRSKHWLNGYAIPSRRLVSAKVWIRDAVAQGARTMRLRFGGYRPRNIYTKPMFGLSIQRVNSYSV